MAKMNNQDSKTGSPQKDCNSVARKEIKIQDTNDLMQMLQVCTTNINKLEYSGNKKMTRENSPVKKQDVFEVDLSKTCSPQTIKKKEEEQANIVKESIENPMQSPDKPSSDAEDFKSIPTDNS